MKKVILTTILLCLAATTTAQDFDLQPQTCNSNGLKGPVHIIQYAWYYDAHDGYTIDNTYTQVYDTAGRLLYLLEMESDGLDDDIYYTYDKYGRIANVTLTKHEPFSDTYNYSADGRLVSIARKFDTVFSQYDGIITIQKHDKQGRPIQVNTYNGYILTYKYWHNGNIRQIDCTGFAQWSQFYNEQGQPDSTIAKDGKCYYRYNNNGYLISRESTSAYNNHSEEYTYDFIDKYGNWTQRTIHTQEPEVEIFERRTIIYYE